MPLGKAQLQGADLENTRLFTVQNPPELSTSYGSVSILNPVYNIDWQKGETWDSLIERINILKQNNTTEAAIKRLKAAREHAINFDISRKSGLSSQPLSLTDKRLLKFHEYRRNLACSDKWIAKGFLNIQSTNPRLDKGLKEYIRTNSVCIKNNIAEFVFGKKSS